MIELRKVVAALATGNTTLSRWNDVPTGAVVSWLPVFGSFSCECLKYDHCSYLSKVRARFEWDMGGTHAAYHWETLLILNH